MNSSPQEQHKASFLGLDFDIMEEAEAAETVFSLSGQDKFTYVVTPNVDHRVRLHRLQGDARLWSSYRRATLVLCDSRILKRLAHLSGVRLELVTGSDLTARILSTPQNFETAAVVGGDEHLLASLRTRYPKTKWLHHAAPHGILHDARAQMDIVRFVERSSAGLVFFAVGSPQSELVCELIDDRGKAAGVALCIGASLEFLTGAKKRAPRWMQRLGLEWLFRLASEPKRLWRRYLVDGPVIFWLWWRWHLNSSRSPDASCSTSSDE